LPLPDKPSANALRVMMDIIVVCVLLDILDTLFALRRRALLVHTEHATPTQAYVNATPISLAHSVIPAQLAGVGKLAMKTALGVRPWPTSR